MVGAHYRTLQQWVAWYRQGGLAEVVKHRRGGRQGFALRLSPKGRAPYLTAEQQALLLEQAAQGAFATIGGAIAWVKREFGVTYTYWGMRSLFQRLKLKKKVPRPLAAKASLAEQEAWKEGAWRRLSKKTV